jgi:hypothetical protein
MINIIFNIIKKIIVAIFLIYGINLLVSSLNIIIPINIITIIITSFLGIPGLITLISLFLLV